MPPERRALRKNDTEDPGGNLLSFQEGFPSVSEAWDGGYGKKGTLPGRIPNSNPGHPGIHVCLHFLNVRPELIRLGSLRRRILLPVPYPPGVDAKNGLGVKDLNLHACSSASNDSCFFHIPDLLP